LERCSPKGELRPVTEKYPRPVPGPSCYLRRDRAVRGSANRLVCSLKLLRLRKRRDRDPRTRACRCLICGSREEKHDGVVRTLHPTAIPVRSVQSVQSVLFARKTIWKQRLGTTENRTGALSSPVRSVHFALSWYPLDEKTQRRPGKPGNAGYLGCPRRPRRPMYLLWRSPFFARESVRVTGNPGQPTAARHRAA
jgi:hypothetical protein